MRTTVTNRRRRQRSRFGRVLAAYSISNLGTGIRLVAIPLLATSYTTDPRLISALAVVGALPGILLALPVGAWVDRAHRGRLMVFSDFACFVAIAALAVCVYADLASLGLLLAVAAVIGCAELVFGTSLYALVPSIVERRQLVAANSRLAIGREIGAGGVGPAVGGVLYAASNAVPFVANAVTYLVSSLAIGSFALRDETKAPGAAVRQHPFNPTRGDRIRRYGSELTAGLRLAFGSRPLRASLVLGFGSSLFGWMPEGTLVLFATQELGANNFQFGLLMAVTAVGSVAGGLVAPSLAKRLGLVRVIVTTFLTYGLLMIPIGLAPSVWVVMVLFFVQGLPLVASGAALQSAQQMLVPNEVLGRFAAVRRVAGAVAGPVGLAAGGFLAAWVGLRATWLIAGAGFVLVFVWCVRGIREMSTVVESIGQSE